MITHGDGRGALFEPVPMEAWHSTTLSPASIVTGVGNPAYGSMRIEFGVLRPSFEDDDLGTPCSNSALGAAALTRQATRRVTILCRLPLQNQYSRHNWTPLPMTDTAIARVHAISVPVTASRHFRPVALLWNGAQTTPIQPFRLRPRLRTTHDTEHEVGN
jgi:hypothetical protein